MPELPEGVNRAELVDIVDDQHEDWGLLRKFRHDRVDHRVAIERGGSCSASGIRPGGRLADRVQNGEPELLGVLLVVRDRYEADPAILAGAVRPRT